jgi:hypothetical protein
MLLRYQPMESALIRVPDLGFPRPVPLRLAGVLDLAGSDGLLVVGFAALSEGAPEADCAGVPTPLPPECICLGNVAPVQWFEGLILKLFQIGDCLRFGSASYVLLV